jgi:hypothetical protein
MAKNSNILNLNFSQFQAMAAPGINIAAMGQVRPKNKET